MEPSRDIPWAEHEKVYLLAEIMKAAPVSSETLFQFIRNAGIQPKWAEIALPQGRSLRQCQMAFQELSAQYSTTDPRSSASAGPIHYPHPQHQPPQQPPQQPSVYAVPADVSRKRPLAPDISTPQGRLLQPRPPNTYPSDVLSRPAYAMSPSIGEGKKRRGRPTKAEAQARAAEAAARGEPYPPPKSKRSSLATMSSGSPGDKPSSGSPGTPASGAVTAAPRSDQMSVSMVMSAPAGERRGAGEFEAEPLGRKPLPERTEAAGPMLQPLQRERWEEGPSTEAGAQMPEERREGLISRPSPARGSTPVGEQKESGATREPSEEPSRRATPRSFKDTVGI
ncbi:uncharacterized protein J3D65DRAFT_467348 [Phyllosticta citribraziliensis]|uniref:Myb-like domain-containing protein n=1 Tax=Phyllosticta citribraziliensis TaxID=989973 RepID=A0ABR1LFM9_9PEZI